eukprot:237813_1
MHKKSALPERTCYARPGRVSGHGCSCSSGFAGDLCSEIAPVAPTSCNPNPCNNGGTCEIDSSTNKAKCTCPAGIATIYGHFDDCSKKLCDPNPCAVGQCSITSNREVCMESNTWQGGEFEDFCPDGYCLNGGTCAGSGSMYYCQCPVGFWGERCDSIMCEPNPCMNGGTCTPNPWGGSYQCACTAGWQGDLNCMDLIAVQPTPQPTPQPAAPSSEDPCSGSPCQNGAT